MILYHGSNKIIQKPIFGYGKSYNDYGLAFYCTKEIDLAKEWACTNGCDGYANKYQIELEGLDILDLQNEKYSVLNWLAILLDNREIRIGTPLEKNAKEFIIKNYILDYKNYDVIIGYRADDSYFSFARSFVSNQISLQQLEYAMKLGKLGIQYAIKSQKAFERLNFDGYEKSEYNIYYAKKKARDEKAKKGYLISLEKNDINATFVRDLIKEAQK